MVVLRHFANDVRSAIRRAVIQDDDFELDAPAGQYRAQGSSDVPLLIPGRDQHGTAGTSGTGHRRRSVERQVANEQRCGHNGQQRGCRGDVNNHLCAAG